MNKRILCALICLSLCIPFFGGCSKKSDEDGYTIAASFYPVYIFTKNIVDGIEDVDVRCMADQTVGCLHDYRLTASDMTLLCDCDALVVNGAGMESFIEDAVKNCGGLKIIDSSIGIELLKEEHDGHEEHGHEEDEDAHEHGEYNSHIWMAPSNAAIQVENIKNALVGMMPEHSDVLERNASRYIERLEEIDKELSKSLSGYTEKTMFVFHEAYAYFEKAYSVKMYSFIEGEEGQDASAKDIAFLTDMIKEKNIRVLFTDPAYKGSTAEILSRETGAEVCVLNPVTNGGDELDSYEKIMRENIEMIKRTVK